MSDMEGFYGCVFQQSTCFSHLIRSNIEMWRAIKEMKSAVKWLEVEERLSIALCHPLSLSVSLCISLYLSVHLCISLSLSVTVCHSLYLSVSLSVTVCRSLYLSVSLSVTVCHSLSLRLFRPDLVNDQKLRSETNDWVAQQRLDCYQS